MRFFFVNKRHHENSETENFGENKRHPKSIWGIMSDRSGAPLPCGHRTVFWISTVSYSAENTAWVVDSISVNSQWGTGKLHQEKCCIHVYKRETIVFCSGARSAPEKNRVSEVMILMKISVTTKIHKFFFFENKRHHKNSDSEISSKISDTTYSDLKGGSLFPTRR